MVRMFDAGKREGGVVVHDRIWTVANAVTVVRLLGLPLFVWLMVGPRAYGMAFLTLVVVGTTDWVDGYIARRFDQVTRLGRLLDPVIDRLLLATAGITLAAVGFLPWWILALIVGRDVVLVVVAYALFRRNPEISVSRLGKFATACLLIGVPGFLLGGMDWGGALFWGALGWVFTAVGVVTYYAAGLAYARAARDRLAAMRAATLDPAAAPTALAPPTGDPTSPGDQE